MNRCGESNFYVGGCGAAFLGIVFSGECAILGLL